MLNSQSSHPPPPHSKNPCHSCTRGCSHRMGVTAPVPPSPTLATCGVPHLPASCGWSAVLSYVFGGAAHAGVLRGWDICHHLPHSPLTRHLWCVTLAAHAGVSARPPPAAASLRPISSVLRHCHPYKSLNLSTCFRLDVKNWCFQLKLIEDYRVVPMKKVGEISNYLRYEASFYSE